jgi:hypothetical protein
MYTDLVPIESLKNDEDGDKKINLIRVKNDIIGCLDRKEEYFNQGLLETLLPMVTSDTPHDLLIEIMGILNSYFFDFPRSLEIFKYYTQAFVNVRRILRVSNQRLYPDQLIDMALRIIKNELASGITRSADLETLEFVDDLGLLLTNRSRVVMIAEILT